MSSEDKFKKLLQQKLSEKEFSFNSGNWEKARQSIDASRDKKKRRAVFLIWSLLLLVLGTGSFFIFYPHQNDLAVNNTPQPALQKNPTADHESTTARHLEQTGTAATEKSSPQSKVAHENNGPAPQQNKTVAEPVRSANVSQPSPVKITDRPVPGVEPALTTVMGPDKAAATAPQPEKENVAASPQAVESTPIKEDSIPPTVTGILPPALPLQDSLVASTPALLARIDTITPVTTPTLAMDETVFPRNLFFVEAGSNYLAGWKNQGKRDANGFNPVLGIGYMNFVTRKIALSVGLQYSSIGNLSNYSHTSKTTRLGLGEESGVTVITPVKMHYLGGVLKLNLAANDKNVVGIGYALNYLFAVQDKVDSYEQRTNFAPQPHTLSKTTGYAEGFNKFDSQLSLFYRRMLCRKLWINAEIIYGITDIKKNAFFGSTTFDHDLGLKLSLMFNLFKK